MIKIHKILEFDEKLTSSLTHLPINLEESLIFDIETTGFSALTSQLYLIGIAYYSNNTWTLIQWMAETKADETVILDNFFTFSNNYKQLVHFNGDNFDIPYLLKKCASLGLPYNFDHLKSFDLYKYFRTFKEFLPLERFSLKEIEKHLQIYRRDIYSGGDLIPNYYNFVHTGEKEDFDKLILHNEDDLIGTIKLLPASLLGILLSADGLALQDVTLDTRSNPEAPILLVELTPKFPLPCTIQYKNSICTLFGQGSTSLLTIQINVLKGVLRHFFANYKDYYYLPLEDKAIHKSVAQFVDSAHKQKAKKSNCYIKKDSIYLPQIKIEHEPVFYKEYNDKIGYFEYSDDMLADRDKILNYVLQQLGL